MITVKNNYGWKHRKLVFLFNWIFFHCMILNHLSVQHPDSTVFFSYNSSLLKLYPLFKLNQNLQNTYKLKLEMSCEYTGWLIWIQVSPCYWKVISEGCISVYFTNQMRIALLRLYGIDKKVLEQEYRRNSLRALGLLVSVHTHRDAYQTTYIHTEPRVNRRRKISRVIQAFFSGTVLFHLKEILLRFCVSHGDGL